MEQKITLRKYVLVLKHRYYSNINKLHIDYVTAYLHTLSPKNHPILFHHTVQLAISKIPLIMGKILICVLQRQTNLLCIKGTIMIIVNIEYPGTWLEFPDKDKAFEIENLISSMETAVTDMAITLTMFVDCQQASHEEHRSEASKDSWEFDRQLRMQIEEEYRNKLPHEHDFYNQHEDHHLEIEKIYRQEKIKTGEVPRSYKHRFLFIHAHSFLSSADTFSKYLSVLADETELDHVKNIKQQFENSFSSLSKIRNSAQHSEDRIRGYGKPAQVKKKIKMDLKPIDNCLIKSEGGGVLALSNLNGDRLGYTIDDGTYQEFEINQNSLNVVANLFQQLINDFQWKGSVKTSPHI